MTPDLFLFNKVDSGLREEFQLLLMTCILQHPEGDKKLSHSNVSFIQRGNPKEKSGYR